MLSYWYLEKVPFSEYIVPQICKLNIYFWKREFPSLLRQPRRSLASNSFYHQTWPFFLCKENVNSGHINHLRPSFWHRPRKSLCPRKFGRSLRSHFSIFSSLLESISSDGMPVLKAQTGIAFRVLELWLTKVRA